MVARGKWDELAAGLGEEWRWLIARHDRVKIAAFNGPRSLTPGPKISRRLLPSWSRKASLPASGAGGSPLPSSMEPAAEALKMLWRI